MSLFDKDAADDLDEEPSLERGEFREPPPADPRESTLDQQQATAPGVRGERGRPDIDRSPSIQSKVSNFLAMGLMGVLGIGMLLWYYSNALGRGERARATVQDIAKTKAQGDVPLPSLGKVEPPRWVEQRSEGPVVPLGADSTLPAGMPTGLPAGPSALPALLPAPEQTSLSPTPGAGAGSGASSVLPTGTPQKTPEQLALERRLSGAVFARAPQGFASLNAAASGASLPAGTMGEGSASAGGAGEMAGLLRAATSPAARAKVLPTQRLLLSKGAFIDCTLETAIDSTLPGMTTCITATDTFSVDGTVVLLERGTKLVGETRGQVQQGSARIFVLWTEARTPTGVVVPLESPGADELGRSGLPGEVNRHFWDRFGAAILISTIDGAIQGAAQGNGGGTVVYSPSTSQDIMTEVLKSTVNIPPSVVKRNGDRIQVLVARDLDFRSVYELHPVVTDP